jgi:hypothetical protein
MVLLIVLVALAAAVFLVRLPAALHHRPGKREN